ncbi:MAG: transcriptional regulator, DeoR family [Pseudonocardiales bacterium]|nr:transcriptional regulator, DeoR family [Pseudonocardiales bacterium]
MYAAERQQRILDLARDDGRVEVTVLAEQLGVTTETVRRDLTSLERHGLLRRVHGGAIPLERLGFEPRLAVRQERRIEEKERIAKLAADEIPNEATILLDSGSTTQLLADNLPLDRDITVVTNSVSIANAVAGRENVGLFLIGGRVRGRTGAAVGDWAVQALANINVDIAFLGTNGLSIRRGLTTPDQDEAVVKTAMVACARRAIVLCDNSKVGPDHFARFAWLNEIDTIITDAGLDDETVAELESAGPNVIRA